MTCSLNNGVPPPYQNYAHSPKVRKMLQPWDHGAPGQRSPRWGQRETIKDQFLRPQMVSPSPVIRFQGGRPYHANSQYEPQMIMPFDKDPVSPLNRQNRHFESPGLSPQGEMRGSRLSNYGMTTRLQERRPNTTQPHPFALSTIARSRRPASVLGAHPPGKDMGTSLDQRLAARELYLAPPSLPINTMMGSIKVTFRDIQAPKQAPKEFEFVRMANARASGSLFSRSFAGSQPLSV